MLLAIGLGFVFVAPVAQAAPAKAAPSLTLDATPQVSGTLVARFTAEMKYDCAGMTGEALKDAIAENHCPANSDATTDNTTVGNCGAAWIDLYDDVPYDGLGRVVWGMTSYQGIMIYRSLLIDYVFTTQDQGLVFGSLIDSSIMFSSTYQAMWTLKAFLRHRLTEFPWGTMSSGPNRPTPKEQQRRLRPCPDSSSLLLFALRPSARRRGWRATNDGPWRAATGGIV